MPSSPAAPSLGNSSWAGKRPAASHSSTWGLISRSTTSRTDLRKRSWSSVSSTRSILSAEGGDARDGLAEHEGVDLVGPLVGEHGLEVVHVADDGVLEGDPVGAEHVAGLAGDVEGLADVVELAEADLGRGDLAPVLDATEVQGEEGGPVHLDEHLD